MALVVRGDLDAAADPQSVHHDLELWLLHLPGAPAAWCIGERERPQKLSPPSSPTWVSCTVTPLASEPTQLGSPLEGVRVVDVVVRDDGTPLAVRIAATPLAVVADGVVVAYVVVAVPVAILLSPITWGWKALQWAWGDDG